MVCGVFFKDDSCGHCAVNNGRCWSLTFRVFFSLTFFFNLYFPGTGPEIERGRAGARRLRAPADPGRIPRRSSKLHRLPGPRPVPVRFGFKLVILSLSLSLTLSFSLTFFLSLSVVEIRW